jgi:hypothetical protein
MTGSSKADFDDMAAPGLQAKGFEKGRNVMEPGQGNFQLLGDIPECFRGQVIFESLNILQDAYQGIVSIFMFCQNLVDFFESHSSLQQIEEFRD